MILLDSIIEDYKQGKLKIITKEVFYHKGYKRKEFTRVGYYLQYSNGDTRRLSSNERQELECIQQNNLN
jgi:hypothetical protein